MSFCIYSGWLVTKLALKMFSMTIVTKLKRSEKTEFDLIFQLKYLPNIVINKHNHKVLHCESKVILLMAYLRKEMH